MAVAGVLSEQKRNFGITRSRNLGECSLTTSPVAGSLQLPAEGSTLVVLTARAGKSPLEIVISYVDAAEWRAAQQYQTSIPAARSRSVFAATAGAHAEWQTQIQHALAQRDRCRNDRSAEAGGVAAAPPPAPVMHGGKARLATATATPASASASASASALSGSGAARVNTRNDAGAMGASPVLALDLPDVPIAPPAWPSASEAAASDNGNDGGEGQPPDLQQLQQRLAALNPASWTAIQLRKHELQQ